MTFLQHDAAEAAEKRVPTMGDGAYSSTASATRSAFRATSGTTAFAHDVDVRAGRASALHESLSLLKKPIRESLDVPGKAPATPILVFLDVTGSMSSFPGQVISELHKLGKMVAEKGVVTDPQFCFAAIGDAYSDRVAIQVGEFEADDELAEKHLANIYLEGGGGGTSQESYDLALYFAAHQTRTSAETRGEKGFMFIIGDEGFYPAVKAEQVQHLLGGDLQSDVPTKQVIREAMEKWHVFLIRPDGVGHYGNHTIQAQWEDALEPQHVMSASLDNILALISGTISIVSGEDLDDTIATMKDSGFSDSSITAATTSLTRLTSNTARTAEGLVAVGEAGANLPAARRL